MSSSSVVMPDMCGPTRYRGGDWGQLRTRSLLAPEPASEAHHGTSSSAL
jgi:hypothetical protein